MKLRSQIILAQVPTAFTVFLITIFFILALTAIEYKAEYILVDNIKNIISMQKFNEAAEELNSYIIQHPKTSDDEIKKLEGKIERELIIEDKEMNEPAEAEELAHDLGKKWEAYKESIHSLSSDKTTEKQYKEMKQITTAIIGLNQDALIRKKESLSNFIIEYRLFIALSSFISLIFGFSMSWIFTGLFLSPLNKMIEIVSQFGKTDETTILHIKGSEEIEKLSKEFNLMTDRLEAYHQSSLGHVYEDYESLKRVFDAFPDPLILFNSDNEIIFINQSASHHFGILGGVKKKNPLLYLEDSLKGSLLKIVKEVILTKKAHIPEKTEEPITILKKNKKIFLLPFAYPIKSQNGVSHSKIIGVFIILQDLTHHSLSALETGEIFRAFLQDFQAPLSEIQIAIHMSLQETAGRLTEKQKEVLYGARDKCDELEVLYEDLLKASQIEPKNG